MNDGVFYIYVIDDLHDLRFFYNPLLSITIYIYMHKYKGLKGYLNEAKRVHKFV